MCRANKKHNLDSKKANARLDILNSKTYATFPTSRDWIIFKNTILKIIPL